jgi:hypothetical protein
MGPRGRAETPEDKREIVERILAAWLKHPHQRLGQLIENARARISPLPKSDLFVFEDEALADAIDRKK